MKPRDDSRSSGGLDLDSFGAGDAPDLAPRPGASQHYVHSLTESQAPRVRLCSRRTPPPPVHHHRAHRTIVPAARAHNHLSVRPSTAADANAIVRRAPAAGGATDGVGLPCPALWRGGGISVTEGWAHHVGISHVALGNAERPSSRNGVRLRLFGAAGM